MPPRKPPTPRRRRAAASADHSPAATEMVPAPPPPPSREALAAALARAAEGEALLADRPVEECLGSYQRLDTVTSWHLVVRWSFGGELVACTGATAPDGGRWSWGCDWWPDWEAGPAGQALSPLRHLLTAEQRAALEARLRGCLCWPKPKPPPLIVEDPSAIRQWALDNRPS
jgi:hypothetical protein